MDANRRDPYKLDLHVDECGTDLDTWIADRRSLAADTSGSNTDLNAPPADIAAQPFRAVGSADATRTRARYLPIQNFVKISRKTSSFVMAPVSKPRDVEAR